MSVQPVEPLLLGETIVCSRSFDTYMQLIKQRQGAIDNIGMTGVLGSNVLKRQMRDKG